MQEPVNAPYIAALEIVEGCYLPAHLKSAIVDAVSAAEQGEESDFHEVRTLTHRYGTPRHIAEVEGILGRIDLDAIRAAAQIGGGA
jgi:hypothetical protein